MVRADIAAAQPLIGNLDSFDALKAEYVSNEKFVNKIEVIVADFVCIRAEMFLQSLSTAYRGIRRSRGDGQCFFRSLLFRLFEYFTRGDVKATDTPAGKLFSQVFAYTRPT